MCRRIEIVASPDDLPSCRLCEDDNIDYCKVDPNVFTGDFLKANFPEMSLVYRHSLHREVTGRMKSVDDKNISVSSKTWQQFFTHRLVDRMVANWVDTIAVFDFQFEKA